MSPRRAVPTVTQTIDPSRVDIVEEWIDVREKFLKARRFVGAQWFYDPVSWARECVDWAQAGSMTDYQEDILAGLVKYGREGVVSPHGVGKSTSASLAVLWFATTRDMLAIDWKCLTTAGAWRQLERYLWPEIHKWASLLDWDKLYRQPFTRSELLDLSLKLQYGTAFAVAASDPQYLEGAHANSLLYVIDEGKSLPARNWQAIEGAFSGAVGERGKLPEAFALALSTPGDPEGVFYDICTQRRGYEEWHVRKIALEDAITAGRVSKVWAEARKAQWGEGSQVYANRVLGEFASSEENVVIPLSFVEAAVERWYAREGEDHGPLTAIGIDVAREGDDETVFALCHGDYVARLEHHRWADLTVTAGFVNSLLNSHPEAKAIVDAVGMGAGVLDMAREVHGKRVEAFKGSERTSWHDRSGELTFENSRVASAWRLRELLDPAHEPTLCLPPDDLLIGDLPAAKWKMNRFGRIGLEDKKDIKARLGRSPDSADAVAMAYFAPRKGARMVFAGRAAPLKPTTSISAGPSSEAHPDLVGVVRYFDATEHVAPDTLPRK